MGLKFTDDELYTIERMADDQRDMLTRLIADLEKLSNKHNETINASLVKSLFESRNAMNKLSFTASVLRKKRLL